MSTTVSENDDQNGGLDGPSLDDVESDSEHEGGEERDDGPAADAGFGAETEEAQARTKRFNFQVVENRLDDEQKAAQLRETEPSLVGRAAALRNARLFKFKTEQKKTPMGMFVDCAVNSDENRRIFFETMFGEGVTRPHIDLFQGRFVDWLGRLVDERYSMLPMIRGMEAAGLEKQSIDPVRKAFKEYIMLRQKNDLIDSFVGRIPEWDGVSRLETRLIDLFECFDTETTRLVGKYFWLSLYNRIMNPGCLAPIVLSLFGTQNAGKSRFSDSICQIVLQRPKAQAVQLDLAADKNDFLREITGQAVVANIGEMVGFNKSDLNKMKSFVAKTSDIMHYKYEGQFEQQRQWVAVLDGNKYEGLQRDASGNRRFYPIFVAQLPDEDGQPAWKEKFQADFSDFEEQFWLIMGECRAWMEANGMPAYNKLVNQTSRAVFDFNEVEMANDRGTIRDDLLDAFLKPALRICEMEEMSGSKYNGTFIRFSEIIVRIADVSRNKCNVNPSHLMTKMNAIGAIKKQMRGDQGYFFSEFKNPKELREWLDKLDGDMKSKIWVSPKGNDKDGGGF